MGLNMWRGNQYRVVQLNFTLEIEVFCLGDRFSITSLKQHICKIQLDHPVQTYHKKVKARLRELAPAARGSQDVGSGILDFAPFDMSLLFTWT